MSAISELFDRVLDLKPTERITIPFESDKVMRSKKTQLYKAKAEYEKNPNGPLLRKYVAINSEVNAEKKVFKLHLSVTEDTVDWLKKAVIVRETGAAELLVEGIVKSTEQDRIRRLKEQEEETTETS